MQKFYLVIEKENLILFEKKANAYDRLYLEGNSEFSYELNKVDDDVNRLLEILVNEYNLDSMGEIEIILISNENKMISEKFLEMLEKYIKEKIEISTLLFTVMKKLMLDKKLFIEKFGLNYDGKNYIIKENKLMKKEFSLLGYTLTTEQLMKYIG